MPLGEERELDNLPSVREERIFLLGENSLVMKLRGHSLLFDIPQLGDVGGGIYLVISQARNYPVCY